MGNISELIPQESQTVKAIYSAYKAAGDAEPKRGYLGASIIGHPCERYLWFCFRQACKPEFEGRLYRLFETGDLEEIRLVKDLRAIGCEVHEVDPSTGQQFEVSEFGGHFSGHMDGCALGIPEAPKTWHVLEFKTHNNKSFVKLKKEGVQKAKPQHYAQMQAYMHKTGMTRALYLARNKDTDELYSERVRYDRAFCENLMERAERVITSTTPPARISKRRDYFECKWCDANEICWGGDKVLPVASISCRQCCFATPKMDGHSRWECDKHGRSLSAIDQDKACDDHLVLPGLVASADPTGHGVLDGNDYIEFTPTYGKRDETPPWRHGNAYGCFTTRELVALSPSAICNATVERAKKLLGAEAKRCTSDDVCARYALDFARVVWSGHARGLQEAWTSRYTEALPGLKPVSESEGFDYIAIEYSDGRAVILNIDTKRTEIRELIK